MPEATGKSQEISKLAQFKWFMAALLGGSASQFYSSLHDMVVPDQGDASTLDAKFWFNLGDWREAKTYAAAGSALAARLGEAATLGPGLEVLDAGFGFGEQDLLWASKFGLKRIVGVNITEPQVKFARTRVELAGLADRVDLRIGSAIDLPVPDASFDRVLALESAHHFNPKDRFFREALRVLRPGGIIATADIIGEASPVGVKGFQQWLTCRMTGSPRSNFFSRDVYAAKLAAAGFVDVRVDSIREDVLPGNFVYAREKQLTGKRADAITIGPIDEATMEEAYAKWASVNMGDYVIATARKPG